MSRLHLRAAACLAMSVLALACSKGGGDPGGGGGDGPPPQPCSTSADCSAEERCDPIAQRCAPKCRADNQCPANSGTRCDEDSGECVPAKTCSTDFNCPSGGDGAYCAGEDPCICVPDTSVGEGQTGVCRRAARTCEPCASDLECGTGPYFEDRPAACRSYRSGGVDRSVCLPELISRCPQGMVQADASTHPELEGLCVPESGDCAALEPCASDSDCKVPGLPICDLVRQICIPGCTFDLSAHESVGCAPGSVCHATPEGSDPELLLSCETSPDYGVGRCAAPCLSDDECGAIDPSYVCRSDGDGKRCRPAGCISDAECNESAAPYRGYCDVESGACVLAACRSGPDPRAACGSGIEYRDCDEGYNCLGGLCQRMDCIELGGANRGCSSGFFCSGEPYRDMITGEPTGSVVEVPGYPAGRCGPMDLQPWCHQTCTQDEQCRAVAGPTDYPDSPPICNSYGLPERSCFWGCEHEADCPAQWTCSSRGREQRCGGAGPAAQFCETSADCTGGSRCVEPLVYGGPSDFAGNPPFKVCECTASEACGAGFTCNAGIATVGVVPGDPTYDKVQARYCTATGSCGAKGSCEWYGDFEDRDNATPRFSCGTAPAEVTGAAAVECPTEAEAGVKVRPGKSISDRRVCVQTSVCQPSYLSDPLTGDLKCSYYGAE